MVAISWTSFTAPTPEVLASLFRRIVVSNQSVGLVLNTAGLHEALGVPAANPSADDSRIDVPLAATSPASSSAAACREGADRGGCNWWRRCLGTVVRTSPAQSAADGLI